MVDNELFIDNGWCYCNRWKHERLCVLNNCWIVFPPSIIIIRPHPHSSTMLYVLYNRSCVAIGGPYHWGIVPWQCHFNRWSLLVLWSPSVNQCFNGTGCWLSLVIEHVPYHHRHCYGSKLATLLAIAINQQLWIATIDISTLNYYLLLTPITIVDYH